MIKRYGKTLNIYNFLTALQEQFALSSLTYQKMELYSRTDNDFVYSSIFNRATKASLDRKTLLKKYKAEYKLIAKDERTFDVQKRYVMNVHHIFKQKFDKVSDLIVDVNMDSDIEQIIEQFEEKQVEIIECVDLKTKYTLSRYAESEVCIKLADDIGSDEFAGQLHSELSASNFLLAMLKKHDLFREDGQHRYYIQNPQLSKLAVISEKVNASMDLCWVAVQKKVEKRAYPSLIFSVQPPLVFYFQPLNVRKKGWDTYETVNEKYFNFYAL